MIFSCSLLWVSVRGKLFALVTVLSLTVLSTAIKFSQLPPLICFLCRSIFAFLFCLPFIIHFSSEMKSQFSSNWKILLLRSFVQAMASALSDCSNDFFPLTKLGVILQTQPAFTMVVAFLIHRELPSLFQFGCGVGAISGSIFVFQPPILGFPIPDHSLVPLRVESKSEEEEVMRLYVGIGIVMTCMIMSAVAIVLLRIISTSCNVHWSLPVGLQAFIGIPLSISGIVVFGQEEHLILDCDWQIYLAVGTVALSSISLQISVYYALKFEKSSIFAIVATSQVFFMPLADYFLYGSLPSLNFYHYFGFAITLTSVLALFVEGYVRNRSKDEKKRAVAETNVDLQETEENDSKNPN